MHFCHVITSQKNEYFCYSLVGPSNAPPFQRPYILAGKTIAQNFPKIALYFFIKAGFVLKKYFFKTKPAFIKKTCPKKECTGVIDYVPHLYPIKKPSTTHGQKHFKTFMQMFYNNTNFHLPYVYFGGFRAN